VKRLLRVNAPVHPGQLELNNQQIKSIKEVIKILKGSK